MKNIPVFNPLGSLWLSKFIPLEVVMVPRDQSGHPTANIARW
jgi:hypothetical protein